MKKTTNYQLNQWDAADPIRREDFNADNAALDAALAAGAQALADYKSANDGAVAQKADQSAFADYRQSTDAALGALDTAMAALAAGLGSGGQNARIACGSYTGTGTYGQDNPTSLTFDFCPVLVIIGNDAHATSYNSPSILIRGRTQVLGNYLYDRQFDCFMHLTWSDNGVSWYNEEYHGSQNNTLNSTYYFVALGYDMAAE